MNPDHMNMHDELRGLRNGLFGGLLIFALFGGGTYGLAYVWGHSTNCDTVEAPQ